VDIADRAQLEAVLSRFRTELPPIRAIVHAAGVRDDAPFTDFDARRIQSVFAGKVTGAIHLDELTDGDPVELFVAFGSASTWFPNRGQAPYVAANAALEGLMSARRARGKAGICLQWGPWTTGMASGLKKDWERFGIVPFEPEVGQALLERFLTEGSSLTAPLLIQTTGRTPVSIREISKPAIAAQDRAFHDELLAMPAACRKRATVRYLQRTVASMMGLPANELPAIHTGLTDLGLDSLMAVELRTRLQPLVGRELSAAVVLEYPTLDRLAVFLVEQLPSPGGRGSDDGLNGLADHDLMRMLSAELEGKRA
jgi:NAD(P)-dependent dehydrogenase (short-subunit alcohol dehydrogenase family)